jgi:hypothetical protein
MVGIKEISAEEYNALDRTERRALQRAAQKNGVTLPEKIKTRTKLMTSVDTDILKKAIPIIEKNNMTLEQYLDFSFSQIIIAENAKNK